MFRKQHLFLESKNVFDFRQKHCLFPSSKICFCNMFPARLNRKKFGPATMFPSLARPLQLKVCFSGFWVSCQALYILKQPTNSVLKWIILKRFISARNSVPIGVEDGKIPNSYVTASSTYNRYHAPWFGRLNNKARGRNKGAWSAKKNDRRQFLQFNLGSPTLITAIKTQGRQDADQWVTSYKVLFGNDGVRFIRYKKGGRVKVSLQTP